MSFQIMTPVRRTANHNLGWLNAILHLHANGWPIVSSGDGLAAYSAVGSVFTAGIAFGANGLNNGAWSRHQNADGNEVCFQVVANGDAGAGATTAREKYSAAAGFTGGSPSATQVPSAADEGVFRGSGTDAAPTGNNLWGGFDNSNGSARIILCVCENVTPFRFWSAMVLDATPAHALGGWLHSTVRAPAGVSIPHPKVMYGAGKSGSGTLVPWSGELNSATYGGGATNGGAFAYIGAVSSANWRELKAQLGQDHQDLNPTPAYNLFPVVWAREDGQTDPDGVFGMDSMFMADFTLSTIFNHAYRVTNRDDIVREYIQLNWFALPWAGAADPYTSFADTDVDAVIWEDQGAYDIGYADGDAAGQITGYAAGYADGDAAGQITGYAAGFADGVASVPQNPPVITNLTPATGAQLTNSATAIQFDVTDPDGNLTGIIVTVKLKGRAETLLAYDGTRFIAPFRGVDSLVTDLGSNNRRVKLRQYPQWENNISALHVYAFDGELEGGLP